MPAKLENSAVATGLEKISFNSKPKERQCQRIFKLSYKFTQFTCQQDNSSSQASAVCEPKTSKHTSWIQKRQRNQRSNCKHMIDHQKKQENSPPPKKKHIYFCFIDDTKSFDCVDHSKLWEILKEIGIPNQLTCLLRNLYACQEATVRTG